MRFFTLSVTPVLFLILSVGILFQAQTQDVYPGWAFYSSGRDCYLYDVDKNLVHTWTSQYSVAGAARLLRDSSALYSGRNPDGWSGGAMTGGQLQIIKWNGELAWDFQYATSQYCIHHNLEFLYKSNDPEALPNVLVACYEKETGTNKLPDKITEIKPTGQTTGEVVWQWYAWEHKTSDPDDNPERLDEDAGGSGGMMSDWNHVNSVSYNYDLDQIVIGAKAFGEFLIIDHSTTTEEASGSSGGTYGKGGDLLYRWGHASNYGISGSDYLDASMNSGFHAACWIPKTFPGTVEPVPGGGNVLIFHNYAKDAVEVELPGDGDGIYPRNSGEAFGPDEPVWTYDMGSAGSHEGSVQRLPNGNTFICDARGSIYEVTSSGQKIWTLSATTNQALKYAYSYFDPQTYAKKKISRQNSTGLNVYHNPVSGYIHISFENRGKNAQVTMFSLNGKELFSKTVRQDKYRWNTGKQPGGIYLVTVTIGEMVFSRFVKVIK